MAKWSIKIQSKKKDENGLLWYVLHIRNIPNPNMLAMELRHLFGKDRVIKTIRETDKKVVVIVDP